MEAVAAVEQPLPAPVAEHQRLSDTHRAICDTFSAWCSTKGFRSFPASPLHLAEYLSSRVDVDLEPTVEAISAIHNLVNLADPTATNVVRAVLAQRLRIEPPRSWSKADQLHFAGLDAITRGIILKRETERDTAIRRAQNDLAFQRKHLKRLQEETKHQEKETTNVSTQTE